MRGNRRRIWTVSIVALVVTAFALVRYGLAEDPDAAASRLIQDTLFLDGDDPEQYEAAWRLSVADAPVREAFLEAVFETEDTAARFNGRAEELCVAAVGLDRETRDAALRRHVLPHLGEASEPTSILEARARLAVELVDTDADPGVVGFIVHALTRRMALDESRFMLDRYVQVLRALPPRLRHSDAAVARECLMAAVGRTREATRDTPSPYIRIFSLVDALQAIQTGVLPGEVPSDFAPWIGTLDAVQNPRQFEPLLRSLIELLARLPQDDVRKSSDVLLAAVLRLGVTRALVDFAALESPMPGHGEGVYRASVHQRSETLGRLAGMATEEALGRARSQTLAEIQKTPDPALLWSLADVYVALGGRLSPEDGRHAATLALEGVRKCRDPRLLYAPERSLVSVGCALSPEAVQPVLGLLLETLRSTEDFYPDPLAAGLRAVATNLAPQDLDSAFDSLM